MKKLEKLKLHNFEEICADEQKSMKGGDGPNGWTIMEGPDGNFYYTPGAVTIYGSAPGYVGDISTLQGIANGYGSSSNATAIVSMIATAIGIFTYGLPSIFLGGASIETGLHSFHDNAMETKIINAIQQVQNSVYFQPGTKLRYSFQGNKVLVWDLETGQLLGESE